MVVKVCNPGTAEVHSQLYNEFKANRIHETCLQNRIAVILSSFSSFFLFFSQHPSPAEVDKTMYPALPPWGSVNCENYLLLHPSSGYFSCLPFNHKFQGQSPIPIPEISHQLVRIAQVWKQERRYCGHPRWKQHYRAELSLSKDKIKHKQNTRPQNKARPFYVFAKSTKEIESSWWFVT